MSKKCWPRFRVRNSLKEGTPAIRNSGKKNVTDQKRWEISKNNLCRFDSQFSIESKNEIKLGRYLPLKKTIFVVSMEMREKNQSHVAVRYLR
jgi:hypothetical protein